MQTTSSGGVAVDLDAVLAASLDLGRASLAVHDVRRTCSRAVDRLQQAVSGGPAPAATEVLGRAVAAALRELQDAVQQLSADAAEQVWRARQADGR